MSSENTDIKNGMIELTTLTGKSFKPEQRELLVTGLSAITSLEQDTINACDYSDQELSEVFSKAVSHHNAFVQKREAVMDIGENSSLRTGGKYSRTEYVTDYAAKAIKQEIDAQHHDQALTRLTVAIAARAQQKQTQALMKKLGT